MVVGIDAGNVGEREDALFGQKVIKLEFAKLDVQPTAACKIVETCKDSLKVEGACIVRGWQHIKGDVFRERAAGMKIEAAPVESVGRDVALGLSAGGAGGVIHQGSIFVLPMPKRGHAKCNRPVGRVLIDGGVALVAQLIAVVLESLSKWTQHWPCLMTRRARHAVLPSEGRYGANSASRNGKRRNWPGINKQNGENQNRSHDKKCVKAHF